jgi:hypothetical protein
MGLRLVDRTKPQPHNGSSRSQVCGTYPSSSSPRVLYSHLGCWTIGEPGAPDNTHRYPNGFDPFQPMGYWVGTQVLLPADSPRLLSAHLYFPSRPNNRQHWPSFQLTVPCHLSLPNCGNSRTLLAHPSPLLRVRLPHPSGASDTSRRGCLIGRQPV